MTKVEARYMTLQECCQYLSGGEFSPKVTLEMVRLQASFMAEGVRPFQYMYWYVLQTGSLAKLTHKSVWMMPHTVDNFRSYLEAEHIDVANHVRADMTEVSILMKAKWRPEEILNSPKAVISPIMRIELWLQQGLPAERWDNTGILRKAREQALGIQAYREHAPLFYASFYKEFLV